MARGDSPKPGLHGDGRAMAPRLSAACPRAGTGRARGGTTLGKGTLFLMVTCPPASGARPRLTPWFPQRTLESRPSGGTCSLPWLPGQRVPRGLTGGFVRARDVSAEWQVVSAHG